MESSREPRGKQEIYSEYNSSYGQLDIAKNVTQD